MATLTDLPEAGPAGDFYAWVLKRYQRMITRLVLLLIVLTVGLGTMAFWFESRLSALEEQVRAAPVATVQGPTLEEWRDSVTQSAQRDAALDRKVTAMTRCLDGNLKAFDGALRQLLLGRLEAREFVSDFKLRSCG